MKNPIIIAASIIGAAIITATIISALLAPRYEYHSYVDSDNAHRVHVFDRRTGAYYFRGFDKDRQPFGGLMRLGKPYEKLF